VLVEPKAGRSLGQYGSQRCLAHFEGLATQIVAIQLNEIEAVQEHAGIIPAVA
jgi:hypothetical protein